MGHAPPHDPVGDAAPDAVPDTQLLLDDGVHEVVGEVAAPAGAAHGEDDAVVPLDERLDRTAVSHPAEGEPHESSLGDGQPNSLLLRPGEVRRGGLTGRACRRTVPG